MNEVVSPGYGCTKCNDKCSSELCSVCRVKLEGDTVYGKFDHIYTGGRQIDSRELTVYGAPHLVTDSLGQWQIWWEKKFDVLE